MVVVVEEHTGLELIDETHGECVWNVRIAFGKVGLRLRLRLGEKVGTGKAGNVSGIEIRVAYGAVEDLRGRCGGYAMVACTCNECE